LEAVSSTVVRSIVPGDWRPSRLDERILLRDDVLGMISKLERIVLQRFWEVRLLLRRHRRNFFRFVKIGDALLPSVVESRKERSDES